MVNDRQHGEHGHVPVMAERMFGLLEPALTRIADDGSGSVLVDGTLGAGGHTEYFLSRLPGLTVHAIDRDTSALDIARERLATFGDHVVYHHARYDEIGDVAAAAGLAAVDGILLDLGVSSMQLDRADRGFAYSVDAPLDMRMNADDELTAADVLNTYDHGALARVLSEYGEERFAGKIASAVLRERAVEPFTTSARLVKLLYTTIPAATRRTGGHPAKRTFQALRIEVNHELESLRGVIPASLQLLAVGGRLAVMSYQSLEDRIVKRDFAKVVRNTTPAGLPVDLPGTAARFGLVTRGAEQADEAEREENPRSAPVRIRAIERIAADVGGQQ
ncbi:16S rRNA (cytosine(1402)-N(4))-methyltransferase RsmH [Gordonia sp. HY002]|uniref:16S rRNA (cytosine(1402)-N(4))-methyltransferase RsmH n=1 Tax=Gordonia zhenghanii TaxID=2911516 RepID=UPI001EF0F05F|nr:16S rRNA (cytosine(1402)-N(4))-methyltransferase RsmH [Gordonia zhenghanii]MCF8570782.1 16S rRNA (cytosine(1402)-N(4))-methyltransferase RsmH [Gordonia zhenghanii]MCF8603783.1 16S rRNA (cytosine(1402)-N(4))-methyltransferase RsmH [Gordonia zhenghanii]